MKILVESKKSQDIKKIKQIIKSELNNNYFRNANFLELFDISEDLTIERGHNFERNTIYDACEEIAKEKHIKVM